jgi:hypothetical protein
MKRRGGRSLLFMVVETALMLAVAGLCAWLAWLILGKGLEALHSGTITYHIRNGPPHLVLRSVTPWTFHFYATLTFGCAAGVAWLGLRIDAAGLRQVREG